MKFRNSIEIKEPSDWDLIGSDILDDFLCDFPSCKGLTRKPSYDEDGSFADEVGYIYTQKGMHLYERMVSRLDKLGNKIFPGASFSYSTHYMIMP